MTTKWPGLTDRTAAVFDRVLLGRTTPDDLANYNIQRVTYFHRVDVAAAGFTTQKFFNVAADEYITNWDSGGLSDENACWFTHFGFDVEHAHTVAYAATAAGVLAGTATTPVDQIEDVRGLMQAGRIVGRIGSREFVNAHGMDNFPLGKGIITGGGVSHITADDVQALQWSNGEPSLRNKYRLSHPIAALPGKNLRVDVTMDTAIPVAAAVVLVCQIEGVQVSPANL